MQILSLTPSGSLQVVFLNEEGNANYNNKLLEPFVVSQAEGLLNLVATKPSSAWPAILWYWRNFIALHITELCHIVATETQDITAIAVPSTDKLELLLNELPPMLGAEYCNTAALSNIWVDFDIYLRNKIKNSQLSLKDFLTQHLSLWQQLGRVCFHLAENKQDPDYPFAFLVTYACNLSHNAKIQYKPINKALQEYAGNSNKKALANLLQPIYNAAKTCPWVQELVASHDLYHPLAWEAQEAYALLQSIAKLEDAGIIVHLPDWWKKRAKPQVKVTIGGSKKSTFGITELLDFNIAIALDGTPLSEQELQEILNAEAGLLWLRNQWVEVDKDKLQAALEHWKKVERDVASGGLSFIEGMRLLAGTDRALTNTPETDVTHTWSVVEATRSLQQQLACLRDPALLKQYAPGKLLKATLRDYQSHGSNWLYFLTELGLGACLADDMGLGKTIQVIALLLIKKKQQPKNFPSLIVLPASLLANWQSELQRFAPSIKVLCYHPSELLKKELLNFAACFTQELAKYDIVLTTYGMLLRQPWLQQQQWNLVVLDEAQAIKNPGTRQTKAVKQLQSKARIALTGTPIENRLGDLWSLFDFICPGLLGSSNRFKTFIKSLEKKEGSSFAPLRQLVQPYILRRLKTDKSIISDLPDKTEVTAWCGLSKEQTALYAQAVAALSKALQDTEQGIKRRGLVLSYLTRFKQICNHPSQLSGDGAYIANNSGKFIRLKEICEEIALRQEKVLIFTQYQEITEHLALYLTQIFKRPGLVLHGGTPVKQRKTLVAQFQNSNDAPFFVLSLKAGGTGLNLTAASHVIHFDRWWNPAVENQATDRAYRIGQNKNVLVHKFVCRGTIEEKVAEMIAEKMSIANDVLSGGNTTLLTELGDAQLIDLVSLNIEQAQI